MKNKKLTTVLVIALVVIIAGVVFTLKSKGSVSGEGELVIDSQDAGNSGSESDPGISDPENEAESDQQFSESKNLQNTDLQGSDHLSNMLCVHVCGAVLNPGVYYLQDGSRVHQAIEMAGGLADSARQEYINMASVLSDGEQVYVPFEGEDGELASQGSSSSQSSANDGLININTASLSELCTLSGIGTTKAQAIIDYREKYGNFKTIEDICNVTGIKENSFEKIKDKIKV